MRRSRTIGHCDGASGSRGAESNAAPTGPPSNLPVASSALENARHQSAGDGVVARLELAEYSLATGVNSSRAISAVYEGLRYFIRPDEPASRSSKGNAACDPDASGRPTKAMAITGFFELPNANVPRVGRGAPGTAGADARRATTPLGRRPRLGEHSARSLVPLRVDGRGLRAALKVRGGLPQAVTAQAAGPTDGALAATQGGWQCAPPRPRPPCRHSATFSPRRASVTGCSA
jgi:hypothetical protein